MVSPVDAPRPATGGWRTGKKPAVDLERCVDCLLCWLYCPDSAVLLEGTAFAGFDYNFCKGCEICAERCPVDAISMVADAGIELGAAMSPRLLTGGEAVAHAMRQIDPDVVPVYPITPQTPIIQGFAKFVADGRAHTEIINVESEHSAMSAAIGAALAGARTMTATSSQDSRSWPRSSTSPHPCAPRSSWQWATGRSRARSTSIAITRTRC